MSMRRINVWIIQRPWSINSDEKAQEIPKPNADREAPPVMEFDNAGNYLQGWGGKPADDEYEWPLDEHTVPWITKATSGSPRPAART